MNPVVANIYGTGGFEKVASEEGLPSTLYDLALMVAVGQTGGDNLEKTASVQEQHYEELLAFDRAGRAMAHQEFVELEKMAHAGDESGLQEFFAEYLDDGQDEVEDLREAILDELLSR